MSSPYDPLQIRNLPLPYDQKKLTTEFKFEIIGPNPIKLSGNIEHDGNNQWIAKIGEKSNKDTIQMIAVLKVIANIVGLDVNEVFCD